MKKATFAVAVAAAVGIAGAAQAQPYPSRPITMVVPFAAGGPMDVVGRIMATSLGEQLGQQVIVENVGGGGGMTGAARVAKATPDGSQFVLGNVGTHAVSQSLSKNPPYNVAADFAPVALIADLSLVLVTRNDLPAADLQEFIAYAKANEDKMQFGSASAGSATHLGCALLNAAIGVNVTHIPYRGGAPAMTAMIGGETQFTAISTLLSLPQIQSAALRAIASGSLARDPQLPDLPTVAEQGFPGFEAIQWIGLLTTAGTPTEIIQRLNAEINRALRDPDLIAKFAQQGISPAGGTPAEFQHTIAADLKNWTETARAANIRAE